MTSNYSPPGPLSFSDEKKRGEEKGCFVPSLFPAGKEGGRKKAALFPLFFLQGKRGG